MSQPSTEMQEHTEPIEEQPPRRRFGQSVNWLVSFILYTLLLSSLWRMQIAEQEKQAAVEFVSNIAVTTPSEEFFDLTEQLPSDPDANPLTEANRPTAPKVLSSAPNPKGTGGGAPLGSFNNEGSIPRTESLRPEITRPLGTGGGGLKVDLGAQLPGVQGDNVAVANDAVAIDRITQEIARQLDSSKVLVCWLLDASISLRSRREEIFERFDRVYRELKILDKDRHEALLSGIVTFGAKTSFITKHPTADQSELREAVRRIQDDDSGKENIFTAVRETMINWRKYSVAGKRKIIMIILTDEIGDDRNMADEAIAQVVKAKVPVYVLGPMAPFGRDKVMVRWVDRPTGEVFLLPTDRGPESAKPEHLALPYWSAGPQFDLFPSGFGPYALTRLTSVSGGIYFVFDDSAIPGPRFSLFDLLEYRPDYQSQSAYLKSLEKFPLRVAVLRAADESRGARQAPPTRFPATGMAEQMKNAQNVAAATTHFVNAALTGLRTVEKFRDKETSKRWLAHYDLMMGRLLAAKVRCDEYNWALAQMRTTPQTIKGKNNNAWELVGDDKISFGVKVGQEKGKREARPSSNVKKNDAKITARAKQDAEAALTYLNRVVEEHDGTPWGMMAKRELSTPLGFAWKETYIEPPARPGERANNAQRQMELDRQKRRAEALARAPKL